MLAAVDLETGEQASLEKVYGGKNLEAIWLDDRHLYCLEITGILTQLAIKAHRKRRQSFTDSSGLQSKQFRLRVAEQLRVRRTIIFTAEAQASFEHYFHANGKSKDAEKPALTPTLDESFHKLCSIASHLFVFSSKHVRVVDHRSMKEVSAYETEAENVVVAAHARSYDHLSLTCLFAMDRSHRLDVYVLTTTGNTAGDAGKSETTSL